MKKVISLFLVFCLLIFPLAACDTPNAGDDTTVNGETTTPEETTTVPPEEENPTSVSDPIELTDIKEEKGSLAKLLKGRQNPAFEDLSVSSYKAYGWMV